MAPATRGAITAIAAAAIALAAHGGEYAMAGVVLVGSLAFAWGFPLVMRASAREGSSVVIGLTAIGAVVTELVEPRSDITTVVLAFGVVAAFLQQMFRRDGRRRLVESVSTTVAGVVIVVSAAGWVSAMADPGGIAMVLVAASALALAAATTFLPGPPAFAAIAGTVVTPIMTAALGVTIPNLEVLPATLIGFAGGAIVATAHALFLRMRVPPRPVAAVAAALTPVLALGIPASQLTSFVL